LPLVDKDKILLPPPHIKLGLMKNFIKAMYTHGKGFEYLRNKFPKLKYAKLKYGIFIESQICGINYDLFVHMLTENEKSAWLKFKTVCLNFLGNVQAGNYKNIFQDLLKSYQTMGCNMSLKIPFFTFPLGLLSSEPGRSERRIWEKVPPGYFHHGETICRNVVTKC
jgi:hypothetical protein